MQPGGSAVTTALVGLLASLATLVVVLGALLVHARRARPREDERFEAAIEELKQRMEATLDELRASVARAEAESRRNRELAGLGGSIDLDEVLARTLEATRTIGGSDAALITIESLEGKPLVATLGLSAEEAAQQAVARPPDGREVRSIDIAYRYAGAAEDDSAIHAGLAVPLASGGEQFGLLAVFTRSPEHVFGDADIEALEDLALRAAPAIDNARRFREARQLADLDALTGLHNRRYFHETLAREVARARRYDRAVALIVLDLDEFKAINDRIGHLAGDAVLAEAAGRVREVVRSADIACRVGGDEFAVILPESTLADADQLYRRLEAALAARPVAEAGPLRLSAGIAAVRPEDDAVSFFQRADDALYRAKERGKGQAVSAQA
jgi:diguanylate cyclase (GGDEF)-like protein